MAELSKKWIADADIVVDYKNKKVRFENEKSILTKKSIALRGGMILFFCVPFIRYPTFEVAFFSALMVSYILWISCASSVVPRLYRRITFRRRRKAMKTIEITNPEGVITYETKHVEPLIDIEYSDDIADALTEITLRREERGKSLRVFKKRVQVLTINLSRRASGVLRIIEF